MDRQPVVGDYIHTWTGWHGIVRCRIIEKREGHTFLVRPLGQPQSGLGNKENVGRADPFVIGLHPSCGVRSIDDVDCFRKWCFVNGKKPRRRKSARANSR